MAGRVDKQVIPDGVGYWPECQLCAKHCANSESVCMEGEGPSNADVMILGESPSAFDDSMNRPFMDAIGEYLRDRLLVDAKIPESKIRFSYAVRCHTLKDKIPTVSEIMRCRRYLEAEIKMVKPKVIVAMGNVPLASMLQSFYKGGAEEGTAKKQDSKVSGIGRWQGKMVWLQEFGCWLLPTLHPTACVTKRGYSTYTSGLIVADLKKAWATSKLDLPEAPMPKSVYVTEPRIALAVLKRFQASKAFAFDIETGGKGRTIDKWVIGCSFSNQPDLGYYFSWEVLNSCRDIYNLFVELISGKEYYKIMHNGAYEVRILTMVYGIAVNGVKYFDTMIGCHLIDENFSKRLKDLAWLYTMFGGYDTPLEKYKKENKIKEDYSKIPVELLAPYGSYDAIATWIIYMSTKPLMAIEKVESVFEKIAMPVRRVMSDAEINGIRVDTELAVKIGEVCKQTIAKLEHEIYRCAGREFNIDSPIQLQKVLYKELKFAPLKETKGGYSADSDSIEFIATQPDSEIAKFLLDRAYTSTMLGTHIGQAIDFTWPEDGRAHTHYNVTGAVTGRCSASQPSLQNVPADRLVRSLYIASEGNFLVEADLKSAEMATIAAISGEQTFLKSFAEGLDIHSETYRRIYDLPPTYVCTKLERRMAKAINFGLVYGMSEMGLAKSLGITIEAASEFMGLYFERLPNVALWMEKQKALVRKNGYVVSVFGRKRRLPLGLSDQWGDIGRAERQAMNSPIQSGAADYTYIGLIRLRQAIQVKRLRGKIVHTVHDCVIVDDPEYEVEEMRDTIQVAFESPVKAMPVIMKVDVEVNQRWGQKNESRLQDIFDSVGLKLAV